MRQGIVFTPGQVYIMGVVNCTPDSFSDGGLFFETDKAVAHGLELLEQGADILDIGGESTRPFSEPVPLEEELKRVIPVVKKLRKKTDKLISVDTQKAEVARQALLEGADIVNDVSALRADPKMAEVVEEFKCMVCVMHMLGSPKDMQVAPHYKNCLKEIGDFLGERVAFCQGLGIPKEHIIIDPGIGFGKRLEDNLDLIANLSFFKRLGTPLLIGLSRKSFLGQITGIEEPARRDVPSLSALIWSVLQGANIVRVHNVEWTKQALQVISSISAHVRSNSAYQGLSRGCSN